MSKIRILADHHLCCRPEDGEPPQNHNKKYLVHCGGQGWQIIRWSYQRKRWEVAETGAHYRLSVHYWCELA
jgi:hypothetical protein